jgi:hypothetical protein
MKRSLNILSEFTLETKDNSNGKVKDFLFDEKNWIVWYLEADFGGLFKSQKVLIPKVFLKKPLWMNKHFPLELSEDEIDKCPKIEDHLPISRKYEEELMKYYSVTPYWSTAYLGTTGGYYPPRPLKTPSKIMEEEDVGTNLRSFKEVRGYHIEAIDGEIGHVDDMIIDDEDMQVIYVVIDTSNWIPWSKKVLLSIEWMNKISYVGKHIKVNLNRETIKEGPGYDPTEIIDEKYEKSIYDFYSEALIK